MLPKNFVLIENPNTKDTQLFKYNLSMIRIYTYENKPWNIVQTELAGRMDTIVIDGNYFIKLIGKYQDRALQSKHKILEKEIF